MKTGQIVNFIIGGIPDARVMIKDVTIPEALEYKEKLKAVDGVTDVIWLDDAASVSFLTYA